MIDRPSPRRRGLTSVAALIALMIIALVCAAILKVGLARRSDVMAAERRLQADWLVESALDRASARLARSPDYPGETWEIPAEAFGGRGAASVTIRVEPVADAPGRRRVAVRADYPSGSSLRARRARETIMDITTDPR